MVTGGRGALGSAVVKRFRAAGATVAVVDRTGAREGAPSGVVHVAADLATPAGAASAVTEALAIDGRIDILAHIAGGFAAAGAAHETEAAVWDRMISLNLTLAHNIVRAVLPGMIESGAGRIVAVGSRAGVEPAAGMSAYCASKAALHMLVRCAAEEVKATEITINAVLPSIIDTPANRAAMPGADSSKWVTPEAIADTIAWLCSGAAGSVNGALVPVYGKV